MDNNKDTEFIFWLDYWRKASIQWPKSGRFKCIVTRKDIRIHSTDNDPDKVLNVDMSSIQACKLGYGGRNKQVDLILSDQKIYLGPVHPIDPHHIQNFNHHEALALVNVIEAFRSNSDPEINPNPYLRQLAIKNYLMGFKVPDVRWDMQTSPWIYFANYQDRFLEIKILSKRIVTGLLIGIIVVLGILGIFYLIVT